MKKGFTLIELLATIVILAIITLIATPIVLETIETARLSATRTSVYMILDGAEEYYTNALLDQSLSSKIDGRTNVYGMIEMTGENSEDGILYVNEYGQIAIAVVRNNVCYKKGFNESELTEIDNASNCFVAPYNALCLRAKELHTEECNQTANHCYAAGYHKEGTKMTSTITYGQLGSGDELNSGDAFDCDVNGDGIYDPTTERFYYVSDLYNTLPKNSIVIMQY